MEDLTGRLDRVHQEQLDAQQAVRRRVAELNAAKDAAQSRLDLLQQGSAALGALLDRAVADGSAQNITQCTAALAELKGLTKQAKDDLREVTEMVSGAVAAAQHHQAEVDNFRAAKEVLKARMLSAELAVYIAEVKAPMDRLLRQFDAILTEFEGADTAATDEITDEAARTAQARTAENADADAAQAEAADATEPTHPEQ